MAVAKKRRKVPRKTKLDREYEARQRAFNDKLVEANLAKGAADAKARAEAEKNGVDPKAALTPSAPSSPDWAGMSSVEFYEWSIRHNSAQAVTQKGIAAAQAMKLALDSRKLLDAARAAATPTEDLTKDERLQCLAEWPEQWLEEAVLELAQRYSGMIELASEAGRSQLTEGGWVIVDDNK